jgi:hypothetical protein
MLAVYFHRSVWLSYGVCQEAAIKVLAGTEVSLISGLGKDPSTPTLIKHDCRRNLRPSALLD